MPLGVIRPCFANQPLQIALDWLHHGSLVLPLHAYKFPGESLRYSSREMLRIEKGVGQRWEKVRRVEERHEEVDQRLRRVEMRFRRVQKQRVLGVRTGEKSREGG